MNNDLISRETLRKALNEAFGCEDATKYGNKNAEQQSKSYSTLMLYEIADIVEDCCDNAPSMGNSFDIEDFKRFVESKVDMQDLYSPVHLFLLLDEYLGGNQNE